MKKLLCYMPDDNQFIVLIAFEITMTDKVICG